MQRTSEKPPKRKKLKGKSVQRGPYLKGLAKRKDILLAAIEVFSRRGYRSASIREIAENTGLTQAGLFHYFSSKEELFVEVLRVRQELGDAMSDDILEALRLSIQQNAEVEGLVHLFVTVSAEAIDEEHPGHEFFRSRYERVLDRLRARIQDGQANGSISEAIEPMSLARMLVALADGLQVQWLLDSEDTKMLAIFDAFCRLALGPAGFAGPGSVAEPVDIEL